MATTTTIVSVKRSLLDEIGALNIASATAAGPTSVQVSYSRPAVDRLRSEAIYFGSDMATSETPEQRISGSRRKSVLTWGVDLVVESTIISDSEDAETRAFAIVAAIENFLAANAQPAEWSVSAVSSGALFVLIDSIESKLQESPEGFQSVTVTIGLTVKERLI
jgi:hypothetical protein